ncbi:sensor histidine kinase [Roseateles saccharophilus]|uniref:histidine kinase n=1 Tax=Roseateles saccharophilus TaxID=304 RepID=A0A4R3UJ06_ROSSA|nr:ATP-binding protein [Roseateles saccharophilus]MDG0834222.1 HAMP domain-containing protein [Roseateles saccharophilus]TCU89916.1 nitrogen fixation/metabolism regulation signal transduction histidine kinase [Roseateles saccharophilus]
MTKTARWGWVITLVTLTGVAGVLAFLLSVGTTSERGFFERHYHWLFWVNVAVAAVLTLVILVAAVRLVMRVRRGRFGSRLLFKLAGIFALVGVVPGLMIYAVSYQFVNRSIETWFDVKLATALEAGLNLGRGTLDAMVSDLGNKTRDAADQLADASTPQLLGLERLRDKLGARTVAIVGGKGQILLESGGDTRQLTPDRPSDSMLTRARGGVPVSELEGLEDEAEALQGGAQIRALALLPNTELRLGLGERYLMVVQRIPASMLSNALAVQAANSEYQQRSLERVGLRRMYLGTLTLVLILAVFAALLLAVTLGNQLARPLLMLADGVRQVAQGDLSVRPVLASRDELGGLTRSFADMTGQLADAREQVQRSVAELESARTHLQTILDNLTAGVLVFDAAGRLETVNPGATRILRLPLSAYVGRPLADVPGLAEFAAALERRFEQHLGPDPAERDMDRELWQESFELQLDPKQDPLTLLVRGAPLPQRARLVVFDDISEVVSAQRSAAWSEVARRLAHEIKNPLTPIQLSAERMQHKLEAKLEGPDQAMLIRSVATIVNQVQAMKQLVNEFRDYARLPSAQLTPLDLNALVQEVLSLYAEAQEKGQLTAELAPRLPFIKGDASQLRQVIHNLVQNALDAVQDCADGRVVVRSSLSLTEAGVPRSVRLHIIDNGHGFAEKVLKRAFEPYVTTKSKGTGLGLAVVKKIADEHGARISLRNLHPASDAGSPPEDGREAAVIGAQVSLSFSNLAPATEPGAIGAKT